MTNTAIQKAGFNNSHAAEWEEIATWWEREKSVHPAVLEFFDNYVHDSRAWFKLIPGNPDNENDMLAMLDSWSRKRKAAASHNQVRSKMHGRGSSIYRKRADTDLNEDQVRAVEEYRKNGKIPRLLTEGREPWGSATDMIACAGYLRYRKVYAGSDSDLIS